MPRRPRYDAPGCVHHVITRGLERRHIFRDDRDRRDLLGRIDRVLRESGGRCFAWVLMPNHVHLVLQSGPVSLSRVMQRINSGYALRYNRRHGRFGYLFQSRFHSRLVEDDADLMGLVRYVHLNPLRGGLVPCLADLARFPWCGHGALMGRQRPHGFHVHAAVLDLFGDRPYSARRALAQWMEEPEADDRNESDERRETIAPSPLESAPDRSGASLRLGHLEPAASLEELVETVCEETGLSWEAVCSVSKRPDLVRARAVICHLALAELRITGRELSGYLGISASAVSRAARRGRAIVSSQRSAGCGWIGPGENRESQL